MDRLSKLLFELSSSERINIMSEIQKQRLKLSHISKRLDMTVTEASRHLQRLSEAKLVEKDVEGLYKLTPFGELTLSLLPSFDFISKHRDYFTTHTISHLPHEFINRIGDLLNCTFTDDVMVAFHSVENLIQAAQEYVWILSNQVLMSTLPFLEEAVKRGVKFRLILPKDMTPPPGFKPIPAIPLIQRRTLQKVDVIIAMSEKQARVAFPTTDKSMDHIGFGSTDDRSHKWCKDLFLYYWERATPGKPKGYPPP
jgi:predicted transcriptional regulator